MYPSLPAPQQNSLFRGCRGDSGAWLRYGLSIAALPVVLANALSMLLSSVILVMKLREVVRTRTAKSAP